MNEPLDISLIVNTFQKPRHLALVLESIACQEGVEGRFEVVVTDDGSTDSTRGVVAAFAANAPFHVAFTSLPHDGFQLARTRNQGARLAGGRTLLFLDGDCVLPRDHVKTHLASRRPGRALLGFCARLSEPASRAIDPRGLTREVADRIVPADERQSLRARHRKMVRHAILRHPSKPRLLGGNFSVWRDDFLRVNGFDERFRGWGQEDDDFGLRLRAAGVWLESILDRTFTLHVWHPIDPTATPRWRDGANVAYLHRRGRLTACRSGLVHRPLADLRWRLPDDLFATAAGRAVADAIGLDGTVKHRCGAAIGSPPVRPEVDLVIRPGAGSFRRRAECRMLVATGEWTGRWESRLDRAGWQADVRLAAVDAAGSIRERLDRAI